MAKSITHVLDDKSREYLVTAHTGLIDIVTKEYLREYSNLNFIDHTKCDMDDRHFENKVIAIKPIELAERYLNDKDQIYIATGGFGCDPDKSGRAVFTICLGDNEKVRWERYQVLGVIKDEHIPQWAKDSLLEIRNNEIKQLNDIKIGN